MTSPLASLFSTLRHTLILVALGLTFAAGCGGSDESGLSSGTGGQFGNNSCTSNAQCTGGDPYCVGGRCVECTGAGDCTDPGQVCDSVTNECKTTCTDPTQCTSGGAPLCSARGVCVRCSTNADCPQDDPICNPALDECVECSTASDCPAGEPFCIAGRGKCAECLNNGHCGAAKPFCDGDGSCEECLKEGDCGAGARCVDKECVTKCTGDAQCTGDRRFCNTATGVCMECRDNTHCTSGGSPYCETGSGQCVECLTNDNCDPDKVCRPNDFKCD